MVNLKTAVGVILSFDTPPRGQLQGKEIDEECEKNFAYVMSELPRPHGRGIHTSR